MAAPAKLDLAHLERRELHLSIFACSSVSILAIGIALFMYPAVFSGRTSADGHSLRVAFFGFCALCILLTAYLWHKQITIRRLRQQVGQERRRIVELQKQASVEVLKAIPSCTSFLDSLLMEQRRTVATRQELSIVVITVCLSTDPYHTSMGFPALGDAAKAIFRKLRKEDLLFSLSPACFGVILPNTEIAVAQRLADRIGEGLADAAGAGDRFSHTIGLVNYPAHASSAQELQQAVRDLMPEDNSIKSMASQIFA
jgi:GGDEF domain-containing protein